MAKRIKTTVTKNSCNYYIIDDFTDPSTKKRSTFVYERLGNIEKIKNRFEAENNDDALIKLNEYLNNLRKADRDAADTVSVTLSPARLIEKDKERLFNIGYLYLKSILKSLGISDICGSISQRYQFKFELCDILCDLVSTRIIFPGSKRSSYDDSHHFIEPPEYELHDVYRALPILSKERQALLPRK